MKHFRGLGSGRHLSAGKEKSWTVSAASVRMERLSLMKRIVSRKRQQGPINLNIVNAVVKNADL